jgi:hypothetical protein
MQYCAGLTLLYVHQLKSPPKNGKYFFDSNPLNGVNINTDLNATQDYYE